MELKNKPEQKSPDYEICSLELPKFVLFLESFCSSEVRIKNVVPELHSAVFHVSNQGHRLRGDGHVNTDLVLSHNFIETCRRLL
jgi:hypothetical protein